MAKKILDDEIDEDFILASMNTISPPSTRAPSLKKEEAKKEEISIPETKHTGKETNTSKEEPRRKKTKADYESLFIRETPITGRKEKTTYLRSKYYRKIQDIILCYDNPGLSVFGYIDTVLSHHFEQYGDDIKEILKKRFEEEEDI